MTEATAGGGRGAVEQRIVQRSLEDAFRRQLLADPKAVAGGGAGPTWVDPNTNSDC